MMVISLYVETITIIQYQMYHISLGNANTPEMKVISSLLIGDICLMLLDYI